MAKQEISQEEQNSNKSVLMDSTQDEIKDAKSDTANTLISKIDQSLESYPWLKDWQDIVIRWILAKYPNAIKSITPEVITIITDKGKFELPQKNTEHEDLEDATSKFKYDYWTNTIDYQFLYKHNYDFHDAIRFMFGREGRYHSIKQVMRYLNRGHRVYPPSLGEVESIISMMPAWDYQHGVWCKSVKEFAVLLWLTDDDRNGRLDPSGKGHMNRDNHIGWAWLGSYDENSKGKDTMLRILFSEDEWLLNFEWDNCLFPDRLLNKSA